MRCSPRRLLASRSAPYAALGTHPDPLDTLSSLLDDLPEELARQAFTHSSWVERRDDSWERLAFLGDVVLSLAVSTAIFPRFESYGAGRLTKLRAQAVSRHACAAVARDLGVPDRLRTAEPAGLPGSAEGLIASDRILASVCESVIGASYLAFGFDRVAPTVAQAFSDQIATALEHPLDHKSVLQERLARNGDTVVYAIEDEHGPPHERLFVASAQVAGRPIGHGEGKTKKAAEQEAALDALGELGSGPAPPA